MTGGGLAEKVVDSARLLADHVDRLAFGAPTAWVYNPLRYAWAGHEAYIRKSITGRKRILFLGMNPGPWGMAQTGVPFGEISHVRDWIGIETAIGKPPLEHPKRPILGFACEKSEVSGSRLWGYFKYRFGTPETFFEHHWVANYCPLVFMEALGRNRTPDTLPHCESIPLFAACDAHLREVVQCLEPEWVIAVGGFAEARARLALENLPVKVNKILHPSPASPAANRGWASAAHGQLAALGLVQD